MEAANAERQFGHSNEISEEVDEERRAFFKRCAKTAAVTIPATALVVAMSSKNASAGGGGCGCGCGGGSPQ